MLQSFHEVIHLVVLILRHVCSELGTERAVIILIAVGAVGRKA